MASKKTDSVTFFLKEENVLQLQNDVLDIIQCDVCFGTPIEPKLLPCQHSFCLKCLQSVQRMQRTRQGVNQSFQCPTCGHTTRIPITILPNCYKTIQLTEVINSTPVKEPVPVMTVPNEDPPLSGLPEESIGKLAEFLLDLTKNDSDQAQKFLEKLTQFDRTRIVKHHIERHGNAVYYAVRQNKTALADYMVRNCPDVTRVLYKFRLAKDDLCTQKWTLLHIAVKRDMLPLVKGIVSVGCDIDAKSDSSEETALMLASNTERAEIFHFLLESGADVRMARKFDGLTCLMRLAMMKGTTSTHNKEVDPGAQMITSAIQHGAIVDARYWLRGCTSLMLCVEWGTVQNLEILACHADVNAQNHFGDTALHFAVADTLSGVDKVKILLQNKADLYARNLVGVDSILKAYTLKNWPVLNVLMDHYKSNPHISKLQL